MSKTGAIIVNNDYVFDISVIGNKGIAHRLNQITLKTFLFLESSEI